jgi:predicted amino acid racemase
MNAYPRINIYLERITHNARTIIKYCTTRGVDVTAITKGVCGEPHIAACLATSGAVALGDSRLLNLRKIHSLPCEKWLIRIPMISECAQVIEYANVSLASETTVIQALNQEAIRQRKRHGILLMADMGDRREGCLGQAELGRLAEQVESSPGLFLKGFGTNLGCYGFVQTTDENMARFCEMVSGITTNQDLTISAGNSSALLWLGETHQRGLINHLRLGEAILLGRERRNFTQMPGTVDNAFCLEVEIVELKEKPSLPSGAIGKDSFGRSPNLPDLGVHWRAIAAIGRQDVEPEALCPDDPDILILGASYDHLLLQVPPRRYHPGDILSFRMQYPAVVRVMGSEYVHKNICG